MVFLILVLMFILGIGGVILFALVNGGYDSEYQKMKEREDKDNL